MKEVAQRPFLAMGAKMPAEHAREDAVKAVREADRAAAAAWSVRMEGYGGPAQGKPED